MLEYMLDGNGTQAAIRAGYSSRGADVQAVQLLGNPRIADKIRARREQFMARRELSVERVLGEIVDIAFADSSEAFDDEGRSIPQR